MFERITHKEEIQDLLDDTEAIYQNANERLESAKEKTKSHLYELGKARTEVFAGSFETFINSFKRIAIVDVKNNNQQKYDFSSYSLDLINDMSMSSEKSSEILKAGFASIGTGAIVGVAAYGGIAMFGTTAGGVAIKSLALGASKGAVLDWLAGTKIAAALGIKSGAVLLGGIVLVPAALTAVFLAKKSGEKKLAEAKKAYNKALEEEEKVNVVIDALDHISMLSNNYLSFTKEFDCRYSKYANQVSVIVNKYSGDSTDEIDFDLLSDEEQKTVHLSWLLTQILYEILSIPIMSEDGKINLEASDLVNKSKTDVVRLIGKSSYRDRHAYKDKNVIIKRVAIFLTITNILLFAGLITYHLKFSYGTYKPYPFITFASLYGFVLIVSIFGLEGKETKYSTILKTACLFLLIIVVIIIVTLLT